MFSWRSWNAKIFSDGAGKDVRDPQRHLGASAVVEAFAVDLPFEEVTSEQLRASHIECSQPRPGVLGSRLEDSAVWDGVGLTEELHGDCHSIHVAYPAEAGRVGPESGLSEVGLQRPVGLGCVIDCQTDDEVDVCRADVRLNAWG